MASKNVLEIIIEAKDNATAKLEGLGGALKKLGLGATIGGGAVLAAGMLVTKAASDMALAAVPVEQLRNTFNNLASSIGENSLDMLNKLREATNGMVADSGLFVASNKFVAMGLATSADEAAKLTEMAVQLGTAMGYDATQSAEDFAMMLANQSIPRLDNFGISSGKVRARILELMDADKSMTRETAFMTATMEQGALTMAKVGDQSKSSAGVLAQFNAAIANLKAEMGAQLLPVMNQLLQTLMPLIQSVGPALISVMSTLGGAFSANVIPAIVSLVDMILPVLFEILPMITGAFGEMLQVLMSGFIPVIVQLIASMLPLIQMVLPIILDLFSQINTIMATALMPIIIQLALTIGQLITAILPLLSVILPPLISLIATLATFISTALVSVLTKLAGWFSVQLPKAINFLVEAFNKYLYPVIEFITEVIKKLTNAIWEVWTWFDKLRRMIMGFVDSVKKPLEQFKNWIDVIIPGSPIPLVVGLEGSTEAFEKFKRSVGGLNVGSFGGFNSIANGSLSGGLGAGGSTINITFKDMTLIGDERDIEWKLKPAIVNVLREALPNQRIA